ncbi:hypothetical protein GCM10009767_08330 [Kocuria aegyptia]|uniref:Uncharacterized protein n=2 Tax=Kocuria aegyptia TaxID=330943 RepID=A0ABP4WD81_9MICC
MRTTVSNVLTGAGAVVMTVALLAMVLNVFTGEGPGDPLIALMTLGVIGAVIGFVQRFDEDAAQQSTPHEALLQARRWRVERIDTDRSLAASGRQM